MKSKLLRVDDAPKVQSLSEELAKFAGMLPAMRVRLEAAEQALAEATQAADLAEINVLAGRGRDADLAAAQARLADCKRERAIALTALQDAEKYAGVLPAALDQARADSLGEVAANLREQYGVALAAFREKIVAALAAHDALVQAYGAARAAVHVPDLHAHYRASVLDAGSAGLLTAAAGLPNLAYSGLDEQRVAYWVAEADALLARLPGMAAEDQRLREALDNHVARQAVEDRAKAAAWAKLLKRDTQWVTMTPGRPYARP